MSIGCRYRGNYTVVCVIRDSGDIVFDIDDNDTVEIIDLDYTLYSELNTILNSIYYYDGMIKSTYFNNNYMFSYPNTFHKYFSFTKFEDISSVLVEILEMNYEI